MVSAEARENAGVKTDDEVDVNIELDMEPREVSVPADVAAALDRDATTRRLCDGLSSSNRLWIVLSIDGAKTAEARERRIDQAVGALLEGRT